MTSDIGYVRCSWDHFTYNMETRALMGKLEYLIIAEHIFQVFKISYFFQFIAYARNIFDDQ
jgi:hypothetical protein